MSSGVNMVLDTQKPPSNISVLIAKIIHFEYLDIQGELKEEPWFSHCPMKA